MNIDKLAMALDEEGELHVVVEEHEAVMNDADEDYIGLRKGNTNINKQEGVIEVDDGTKMHYIDASRIVYFHAPNEFPD